jgi:hypothetical protein
MEQLVLSMLAQNVPPRRNGLPAGIAFILATAFALAGAGFILVAGYDWLQTRYDIQTARLYMGGFSLGFALIIGAIAFMIHLYKREKVKAYYHVVRDNIENAMHMVGDELEEPIRENPKTAMLMAGLAGYIAAEKLLH